MQHPAPTRLRAFAGMLALVVGCMPGGPTGTGGGGSGGTDGNGGNGGSTGAGGGTPDPEVPTFTWLYDNMFHGYCSDRDRPCHNPNTNRGVDFSSRDLGYLSIQFVLVPGDAFASDLFYLISDGQMPPINPRVPADLQAKLAAWIDAGALDN